MTIDRKKLEALHKAATAGEWRLMDKRVNEARLIYVTDDDLRYIARLKDGPCFHSKTDDDANAELVSYLCSESTRTAIITALTELNALRVENERMREFIANPPRHDYWTAGDPDCPKELKAGNGELHTLRCKACGNENAGDPVCRAALQQKDKDDE